MLATSWLDRRARHAFAALLVAHALPAAPQAPEPAHAPRWHAERWPAAEQLFRSNPRWRGGDAVWSVDLGGERTLWLFGDSFVTAPDSPRRAGSTMVRNSLAITRGRDLANATIAFHWREVDARPASFFAEEGDAWFWPAHAARVGDRLLMLQWRIVSSEQGLGFAGAGWRALIVDNPDAEPEAWHVTVAPTTDRFDAMLGSAVVVDGEHLCAFATGRTRPGPTLLTRWPLTAIANGDLREPEWCDRGTWRNERDLREPPAEVVDVGQSEFAVVARSASPRWLLLQTVGFGGASLALRTADALSGPWSAPVPLYEPTDRARERLMIYSAKLHPMLRADGGELVASFSTNHLDFATLVADEQLYYPRFLRLGRR